ncbi:MAG: hypothetical protein ABIA93_01235 [Candidatus Woesearchaeota archaeon]
MRARNLLLGSIGLLLLGCAPKPNLQTDQAINPKEYRIVHAVVEGEKSVRTFGIIPIYGNRVLVEIRELGPPQGWTTPRLQLTLYGTLRKEPFNGSLPDTLSTGTTYNPIQNDEFDAYALFVHNATQSFDIITNGTPEEPIICGYAEKELK